ncbi:phage terminase small subunit [Sediminibacillus massiliensis]|uniref:phage terminase small subunit n=1 Tax=Sediminibacillus massiliensis TaxID=1926277 RepID=UPI0009887FF7|nr:phage terminase small subunit [Sediminibacillus massiliensis]
MKNKPHANYCGAKTRSGQPCKNRAMPNGRCRMHGGKSTGAPPAKMKKNTNANKHNLFTKYLPQETIDIMGGIDSMQPIDILWMNIQMQFASIIRAQQIMYVKDQDDRTETLKKLKVENVRTREGPAQIPIEREYEIQQAWDKQATFMNSLSRSMAELRNMLKQFDEMASLDDERRLKLQQMNLNLEKTKAEIEKLTDKDSNQPIEITIKRKEKR